jgi:hypothetical protein
MILDLIGALIRYGWTTLMNKIYGNEIKSFSEFTDDKNLKVDEKMDKGASDTIVGGIFLVLVLVLIFLFS